MIVTLADGTHRSELWRLVTNLLDAERYPAHELIALYHRRWQAETCYFSLKSTILNGRVLRSRTIPGIEQEVYALLTVYQVLVRAAGDVVTAQSDLSAERISLTVLLNAGADQIVAARGIAPTGPVSLVGAVGRAALAGLLPRGRRWWLKARDHILPVLELSAQHQMPGRGREPGVTRRCPAVRESVRRNYRSKVGRASVSGASASKRM